MHTLLGTDEAFIDELKTDISNFRSLLCSAGQRTGRKVSLHLPILRLPSGSTFITACRTKSDSELGSVSVPLHYPPAVVVCICIVWHIFLRKAIFNSSSTLLFNMHVTLSDSRSSILEYILV